VAKNAQMSPRFYLDLSPLQESEYTGIPQVVAKLCEELLGDSHVEPRFFYNRYEIPIWLVEHLLRERNGALLRWGASRYTFGPVIEAPKPGQKIWGLHTNMKFARRLFPVEGQIVHDLTTVVTPQYHTRETNEYHQTKWFGDLTTNDIIFTVSHSTAMDLISFYGEVREIPIVVTHLGVDWTHIPAVVREASEPSSEPYIFILGTLEPRKNVGIVLDFLESNPSFTDRFRFVFGGRIGWGDIFEQQLDRRGLGALAAKGRIIQTGFVSEIVKYRLLKNAAAVVYPSVYEGFGLPLAEALSLGVPVVTTASSSLPEVGRDFANYFDPSNLESFIGALEVALSSRPLILSRSGESLTSWRKYFSWSRCYAQMRDGFARLESR
jgi:glycosyltransferase involved in cell wall biosynthesis